MIRPFYILSLGVLCLFSCRKESAPQSYDCGLSYFCENCEVLNSGGEAGAGGIVAPQICSDTFFCEDSMIYQGADGVFCGPVGCEPRDCLDTAMVIGRCSVECSSDAIVSSLEELCDSLGGSGGI